MTRPTTAAIAAPPAPVPPGSAIPTQQDQRTTDPCKSTSQAVLAFNQAVGPTGATSPVQPTTGTSAGAAFTRSLLLFLGFMFRRPGKLFRPNRLDTWAGLRRLAESADQNLSPSFVRSIFHAKGGPIVIAATLLPPLIVNTTLGFLLFSSHSLISLYLAKLPFFNRHHHDPEDPKNGDKPLARDPLGEIDGDFGQPDVTPEEEKDEEISLENIIRGPRSIPKHPTLLSAIAGAGAGIIQGLAFTPIENIVRFISQSASSITVQVTNFLHLPTPKSAQALGPPASSPIEAFKNLISNSTWHKTPSWWMGWRWAVGRDAFSYSIFFATFDLTRRLGLRVKAVTTAHVLENLLDGDKLSPEDTEKVRKVVKETEAIEADVVKEKSTKAIVPSAQPGIQGGVSPSGEHKHFQTRYGSVPKVPKTLSPLEQVAAARPPSETPTAARVAQAVTIVLGGVAAASAAEFSGRPFRKARRLAMRAQLERSNLPPGATASFKLQHPVLSFYRENGLKGFYKTDKPPQPPAKGFSGIALRVCSRIGWRIAAMGPWGAGFLIFAWIGGEV